MWERATGRFESPAATDKPNGEFFFFIIINSSDRVLYIRDDISAKPGPFPSF
jgi:hypothetical protein